MDQGRAKHQEPSTKDYVARCFILLASALFLGQTAREPSLPDLLQRAGQYVRQLERDVSTIISDERYEQQLEVRTTKGRDGRTRKLVSEMSFVWMRDDRIWLSVRSVDRVDGQRMDDSRPRLKAALADATPGRAAQIERLRDEGARFNIGGVERNFSDPMLSLQIADPSMQQRFTFAIGGSERIRGQPTVRVTFVEHGHPTLVQRGTDRGDLPAHGDIWLGPTDGVIHQTRLVIDDERLATHATVTVTFAHNAKLDRWLPLQMDETYARQGTGGTFFVKTPGPFTERIECVAKYTNYRRFETSGRVVPP